MMWSPFWDVSQSKSNHIWIPKVNPIANPIMGLTLGIYDYFILSAIRLQIAIIFAILMEKEVEKIWQEQRMYLQGLSPE